MEKLVKYYGFSGGLDGVAYMPKTSGAKFVLHTYTKPTKGTKADRSSEVAVTMSRARLKALYLTIGQVLEESEPVRNSHNNPYMIEEPLG